MFKKERVKNEKKRPSTGGIILVEKGHIESVGGCEKDAQTDQVIK